MLKGKIDYIKHFSLPLTTLNVICSDVAGIKMTPTLRLVVLIGSLFIYLSIYLNIYIYIYRFVYVWDFEKGTVAHKLGGHNGSVNDAVFHPTYPNLLASASSDATLYVGQVNFA